MGKYRRIRRIGSGGFGEVWEALSVDDNRKCAMKCLNQGANDSDKDRFRREVRLIQSLDHPNIVRIEALRVLNEPLWFAMPLCASNLRQVIQDAVNDPSFRRRVISQLLDAVRYAHKNGIIHRDLKPENILIDTDGNVLVADFGLSRDLGSHTPRQTSTGVGFGTPDYMAPEQKSEVKLADHRCDIYALGVIIHELHTGELPAIDLASAKLDSGLRHVVKKCTRQEPNDRYASVDELMADLRLVLSGNISARPKDEVNRAIAELLESPVSSERLDNLLSALRDLSGDTDSIRKAFIQMPLEILQSFSEAHGPQVAEMEKKVMEQAASAGWPFEYCDILGDMLVRIYRSSPEAEIRARAIITLMELGYSHNRFYVIDLFRRLIREMADAGEILELRDMLKTTNPLRLVKVKGDFLAADVPLPLQEFMRGYRARATDAAITS